MFYSYYYLICKELFYGFLRWSSSSIHSSYRAHNFLSWRNHLNTSLLSISNGLHISGCCYQRFLVLFRPIFHLLFLFFPKWQRKYLDENNIINFLSPSQDFVHFLNFIILNLSNFVPFLEDVVLIFDGLPDCKCSSCWYHASHEVVYIF